MYAQVLREGPWPPCLPLGYVPELRCSITRLPRRGSRTPPARRPPAGGCDGAECSRRERWAAPSAVATAGVSGPA